jgi:aminoglycoside phosphotransferase
MALGVIERTESDVVVAHARGRDGSEAAVVKLARTAAGGRSLRRAADQLAALHADPRVDRWEIQFPEILDVGELDGLTYTVESALAGEPIARPLERGAAWQPLAALATTAIEGLHSRTATVLSVNADLLDLWIERPLSAVAPLVADSPRRTAALRELGRDLTGQLQGGEVTAAWVHGDFGPGNVLIDAESREITGIVDWELAGTPDLPMLDRAMFLLATHMQTTGRQLGALVAGIATGEGSTPLSASLIGTTQGDPDDPLGVRSVVLLCWLRHVAALVTRTENYARNSAWKRHNVNQVLDALVQR